MSCGCDGDDVNPIDQRRCFEMSDNQKTSMQPDSAEHLSPEQVQAMDKEPGAVLEDRELERIAGGWQSKACGDGQHDYRFRGWRGSSRLFICEKCGDGYLN